MRKCGRGKFGWLVAFKMEVVIVFFFLVMWVTTNGSSRYGEKISRVQIPEEDERTKS